MATFLVTGIAGFIGSSIAEELVSQGHCVRGLDDLSSGKIENLDSFASSVELRVGDVRDYETLLEACAGVDYVFHEAAVASVPRSVADPETSHEINITGTLNILRAARSCGVKRIVYAASSSAYGDIATGAKTEEMLPQPLSPYAVQKLSGEHYVQSFAHVYGLEGVCLRYFNIFGPRQAADSPYSGVIAKFATQMLAGEVPTINGDGAASRDFTYIENVVRANLLACMAPAQRVSGKVYNIGTGQSQTLNQLFAELATITGFTKAPVYGPAREGDVQHSLANIERARVDLGYNPSAGFAEGLANTVKWYQSALVNA